MTEVDQATIAAAQATIEATSAMIVQAWADVFMVILAFVTTYVVIQQNRSVKVRINLALYDKRFKIYNTIELLINSVVNVSPPQNEADVQRFSDEIGAFLQIFRDDSKERIFLIDDDLNMYINSIDEKISNFSKMIVNNLRPNIGSEYVFWYNNVMEEKNSFIHVLNELPDKFKSCLDFKKI